MIREWLFKHGLIKRRNATKEEHAAIERAFERLRRGEPE